MGKLEVCCSSLCGFCGKVLRARASLRVLMFLCFFWTTFNIVLSSMTVTPLWQYDKARMGYDFLDCPISDLCRNRCPGKLPPPIPVEMIVISPSFPDVVLIRLFCPWPVSANASRFCCAICCIIMFTGILIWAFRQPNSKPSKLFYVIPFIGADLWWWAVMFTDATELASANNECKRLLPYFIIPSSLVVSVRIPQCFLCLRCFLTTRVAVSYIQPSHVHCSVRRRVCPLFLDPLHLRMHVINPPPPPPLPIFPRTPLTFVGIPPTTNTFT
jgi:hypothetical protein